MISVQENKNGLLKVKDGDVLLCDCTKASEKLEMPKLLTLHMLTILNSNKTERSLKSWLRRKKSLNSALHM